MMTKRSVYEEVVECWESAGVDIQPGIGHEEERNFQRRWGAELPAGLLELLRISNGMSLGELDSHSMRIWPIDEFQDCRSLFEGVDEELNKDLIVFADFLLVSHGYAIHRSGDSGHPVYLVGANRPIKVADSLQQFWDYYLNDPSKLY